LSNKLEKNEILSVLVQAFNDFNKSADKLSAAYDQLVYDTSQEEDMSAYYSPALFDLLCGALECMVDGVVVIDRSGRIVYFNETAKYLTELRPASVLGKHYSEIFNQVDSLETISTGEPKYHQKIFRNGTKVETYTKPIKDKYGSTIGAVEIFTTNEDERRQKFNIPDRSAVLIKAVGDIIMNIVHLIRSPLGAIQLFTELLKGDLDDQEQNIIDEILTSVYSLDAVLSNLLSAVQPITPSPQKLDFINLLEESLAFASLAIKQQNIILKRDYSQDQIYCYGDIEQLKQICFNLILNAIQAMPESGTLRVSVSYSDYMKHINVEIEDNGCGIPDDLLDRVFTPFFTTKEGGTGLGLYVVYRIIQAHKGMIYVNSIYGVGTTVSIKLPT
jgi:signal transduction histidine kinase